MNSIQRSNPLVSVVIPHYRHPFFVEKCLESVWAQTYGNIQLIVVDDCSPDNSGKLVKQLIDDYSQYSQLTYPTEFYQFTANQGAHAAINYGIHQAKGSIITILNSDDVYCLDRVRSVVSAIQENNADLVFTKIRCIDENNYDITESSKDAFHFFEMQKRITNFPTIGFACLASNSAITSGNLVFTKDLYEKVGGFRNFKYCHDWDFLLRAILYTEPVFLDQELYNYRLHSENTFGSVQSIAVQECDAILYKYLMSSRQKVSNSVAPTPLNWPRFFELFIDLLKYSDIYKRVSMDL